jgi:succinoglycan biosynthesis protein ExoV
MKLWYFRGEGGATNFGDELNPYLWRRLLPGMFDEDDGTQFVGIGTLLNDRLPSARRTVVFGSGVGYYGPPQPDDTWKIYCVRGPLSARALGLAPELAITDPAALLARSESADGRPMNRSARGFMPHWQSNPSEWERVCRDAGIEFIDPRWAPARVLDAIRRCDVLLAEAMHGAVVADALRIPWIPVRTRERIHTFKWDDWCASLGLEYRPVTLPTLWPARTGTVHAARRLVKRAIIARALGRIARRATPVLSDSDVLNRRVQELERRLDALTRDSSL